MSDEKQSQKKSLMFIKIIVPVIALLIGLFVGYFLFHSEDPNSRLEYGTTGLPKNCRAIISANIDSYQKGEYTAEDVLESINRNCGEFGLSWVK